MKSLKPGTKYQSVSLAVPFIEEIKNHIKDSPQYRSIADFVRDAVREKMDKDQYWKIWDKKHKKEEDISDIFNLTPEQVNKLSPEDRHNMLNKLTTDMRIKLDNRKLAQERKTLHQNRIDRDKKKGEVVFPISESLLKEIVTDIYKETIKQEGLVKKKAKVKNSNGHGLA